MALTREECEGLEGRVVAWVDWSSGGGDMTRIGFGRALGQTEPVAGKSSIAVLVKRSDKMRHGLGSSWWVDTDGLITSNTESVTPQRW